MAQFSHLLIVDSHASREDPLNRFRLLQLLIDPPAGIAIRDLNWSRLTPWRDLISQFFDTAASQNYWREISEIVITRNLSATGSIPTRTLLLTGWLASRLGWQRISAERSGDRWISHWDSPSGRVSVNFSGIQAEAGQIPGINSIVLKTRSGPEFAVSVEQGSSCLTAIASIGSTRMVHSVPHEVASESALMIRELSQTGEDLVFKSALSEALELEKSFLH